MFEDLTSSSSSEEGSLTVTAREGSTKETLELAEQSRRRRGGRRRSCSSCKDETKGGLIALKT